MRLLITALCTVALAGCASNNDTGNTVKISGRWANPDPFWTVISPKTGSEIGDLSLGHQVFFAISDGGAADRLHIKINYGIVYPPINLWTGTFDKCIPIEISAEEPEVAGSRKTIWSGYLTEPIEKPSPQEEFAGGLFGTDPNHPATMREGITITLPDLFTPEYLKTHKVSISRFDAFRK